MLKLVSPASRMRSLAPDLERLAELPLCVRRSECLKGAGAIESSGRRRMNRAPSPQS